MDSNTKPTIYSRDRSELTHLPSHQICSECSLDKTADNYRLAKRNQYAKEGDERLAPMCNSCFEVRKLAKKGVFLNYMKTGTHIISDAVIQKLVADNNKKLMEAADQIVSAATSTTPPSKSTLEALNLLVTLVQGRPLGTKLLDAPQKPPKPQGNSESSEPETSDDDDLLERVQTA